jgi:hypothetical protein
MVLAACGSSHKQAAALLTTTSSPTVTTSAPSTTEAAAATSTSTTTSSGGCSNISTTADLRAQLVTARGVAHLIIPEGDLFYGMCDTTKYAAALFRPDSTNNEQAEIASQDDGSVWQYFKTDANGNWTATGSAPFPNPGNSCAPRNPAPQALVTLWNNCAGAPVS